MLPRHTFTTLVMLVRKKYIGTIILYNNILNDCNNIYILSFNLVLWHTTLVMLIRKNYIRTKKSNLVRDITDLADN